MSISASIKQMIAEYEQKLAPTEADTSPPPYVHIKLASLYLELANLENEEENIQKSIEFSQLTLQTNQAILDSSGFPDESLKRQNALAEDNLAQAYIALGKLRKDQSLLLKAVKILPHPMQYFEEKQALNDLAISLGNYADAYYQLAQLTAQRDDLLIAASEMEAARTAYLNTSNFYRYNKMSCHVSVMYFQLMLGSKTPAQVTKYYEQILDIAKNLRSDDEFSSSDIALYLETSAFASLEYWKHINVDRLLNSAIKALEKAINFGFSQDSAMTRAKVYHELGQAYVRLGQQEKANPAITQAINNYKQAERYDLVKDAERLLETPSELSGCWQNWFKKSRP